MQLKTIDEGLFRLWIGNKLPKEHLKPVCIGLVGFIKHWFFHPIKRRLAKWYLIFLKKVFGIKVIGITGSAGKTTTKEMLASVLKKKFSVVYSTDNIDPVYNIPTTILKCSPLTKYLILEMGVEYPCEMDFYLWLARPDIVMVTNIFPAHTVFLGDIEGVYKEKAKIIKSLSPSSVVVLNKDNSYTKRMSKITKAKVLWFESKSDSLSANVNAVKELSKYLGISDGTVKTGIEKYDKPKHRFNIINHKSGAVIFDDSYNSNPEALKATLKMFYKLAKDHKKAVVLGDMLELGKDEVFYHKQIKKVLQKYNIKNVVGVGKLAVNFGGINFASWEKALPYVRKMLVEKPYILIKGSRSIGLDNLVKGL